MGRIVVGLMMLVGCGVARGPVPTAPPLPATAVVATIPVGTPPTLLAMSPDGSRVFAASSGKLTIIRTSDDQVAATATIPAYTSGVAVTRDGARVLIDNVTGASLIVVDAATGTLQKPIPLILEIHPGGYERIALTPDGRSAIVANQRKEYLAIADLRGGPPRESLLDQRPSDVTFSPDGRSLYVTGCRDFCTTGTVEVLDATTLNTVRSFAVGPSPYRFALSPDGTRAYTTILAAPSVSIVDVASGTITRTVTVGVEPTGLAVSPDGARVYVASQMARTLTVIDAQTGTVVRTMATPTQPREVVVSPDGRRVYLSTQESVLVLDPQGL
jgi:YVTN family beta-propeller protein